MAYTFAVQKPLASAGWIRKTFFQSNQFTLFSFSIIIFFHFKPSSVELIEALNIHIFLLFSCLLLPKLLFPSPWLRGSKRKNNKNHFSSLSDVRFKDSNFEVFASSGQARATVGVMNHRKSAVSITFAVVCLMPTSK